MHSQFVIQTLLTVHLVGLAFGLGAATVADVCFLRAMRTGYPLATETVGWLRTLSAIIWVGLAILTVSGVGLFFTDPSTYIHMAGFQAKMVFVLVLILNGLFLNFCIHRRLLFLVPSSVHNHKDRARRARKVSFISGAVSISTWYCTVVIAMFKSVIHLSLVDYLLIYLSVIALSICGSLLVEHLLTSGGEEKALRPGPSPQTVRSAETPSAAEAIPDRALSDDLPLHPRLRGLSIRRNRMVGTHERVDEPIG